MAADRFSPPPHGDSESDALPIDPDLDAGLPFAHPPAGRPRPRLDLRVLAAIAAGGFVGGLLRYLVAEEWAPTSSFPWAVFTVNTAGALVLGLLLVLVLEVLPPTRYLRPAVGTGFCGALTTFSSVVVAADQLAAHGRAALAVGYVVASLGAGLGAASFGIILGRAIAASWERQPERQTQRQPQRQTEQG